MPLQQGATNAFKTGLASATFNFNSDSFKVALYTGAATLGPTTSAYSPLNEVSSIGTGYTAGGILLAVSVPPTTGTNPDNTVAYLSFANVTWSPAAFTCRGALIYKVGGGDPTVCVLDFGSDKTCTTQFQIQFPAVSNTSAIIRIA
jgi:hypothetical protein